MAKNVILLVGFVEVCSHIEILLQSLGGMRGGAGAQPKLSAFFRRFSRIELPFATRKLGSGLVYHRSENFLPVGETALGSGS